MDDIKQGNPITADWLNALKDEVQQQSQLTVCAPLVMIDSPGGKAIALALPNDFIRSVIPLTVTDVETGAGWYKGTSYSGMSVADPTVDLAMPLQLTAASSPDLLIANLGETSGHAITTPIDGVGIVVGYSNESAPRRVVFLIGISAPPSLKFAKITSTWAYGGNTVAANPCKYDGTAVDTTTTLTLDLFWPQTEAPQFFPHAAGVVVAFQPYSIVISGSNGLLVGWRQIPVCSERFMVLQGDGDAGSTAVTGLVFNYTRGK